MRRWALLVMVVVLAGCGVKSDSKASFERKGQVPFGLLDAPTTTVAPASTTAPVAPASVCFVLGDRLVPLARVVNAGVNAGAVLQALDKGVTGNEARFGLRSALGDGPTVVSAQVDADAVRVDLAARFADLPTEEQRVAIAQMVCTLTGLTGIMSVRFTLSGTPIEVPRGDGSLTGAAVTRADYPILIPAGPTP